MDHGSPHLTRDERPATDLASIVLGAGASARPADEGRRAVAPEAVPLEPRPGIGAGGFDARSVIVLALVVAVLAAVVGWVATGRDDDPSALPSSTGGEKVEAPAADEGASTVASTVGDEAASQAVAKGVDLAIGRVATGTSGSSGASVVVGVANHGGVDLPATDGATLLVLVDGAIAATAPLPALAAEGATRVDVPLNWCPAGAVPVTVVLDPGAVVRELDERNGAVTRTSTFTC
jgi:hypothetical protein